MKLIRGCKMGKGIFASFVELEARILKDALEPILVPMSNNTTCGRRYGKECSMDGCDRFIDGIVVGHHVSWRCVGKTM